MAGYGEYISAGHDPGMNMPCMHGEVVPFTILMVTAAEKTIK